MKAFAQPLERALTQVDESRKKLELWTKRTFWSVLAAMVGAGWIALTFGAPAFDRVFEVEPEWQGVAGASLVVCAMSLVAAAIAFANLLIVGSDLLRTKAMTIATRRTVTKRDWTIRVVVPTDLEPLLPVIVAILVGLLIGTTIFV